MQKSALRQSLLVKHYENTTFEALEANNGAPRPQFGAPPFRPQPFVPREESEQSRELAGYERREAQRQRGPMGWRGGAGGPAAPQGGGGWRQRRQHPSPGHPPRRTRSRPPRYRDRLRTG